MLRFYLILLSVLTFENCSAQIFNELLTYIEKNDLIKKNKIKTINVYLNSYDKRNNKNVKQLQNSFEFNSSHFPISNYINEYFDKYHSGIEYLKRRTDNQTELIYKIPRNYPKERTDTVFCKLFTYNQKGYLSKVYNFDFGNITELKYDDQNKIIEECTYNFIKPTAIYNKRAHGRYNGEGVWSQAVMVINNKNLSVGKYQMDSLMAYKWSYLKKSFTYKENKVKAKVTSKTFREPVHTEASDIIPDSLFNLSDYLTHDQILKHLLWRERTWSNLDASCDTSISVNEIPKENKCFKRIDKKGKIVEYVTFFNVIYTDGTKKGKSQSIINYDTFNLPEEIVEIYTIFGDMQSSRTEYYSFEYEYFGESPTSIYIGAKSFLLQVMEALKQPRNNGNDDSICRAFVPIDTLKSRLFQPDECDVDKHNLWINQRLYKEYEYAIDSSCTREIEDNVFYFRLQGKLINKYDNSRAKGPIFIWFKIWFDGKRYWLIPGHHYTDVCIEFYWTIPGQPDGFKRNMAPWTMW